MKHIFILTDSGELKSLPKGRGQTHIVAYDDM